MADRLLLESGSPDGYLLEDGTGVVSLDGPATYRAAVLADNPVGYWRLGEPSGTNANDETANNNDGTYTNTPTLGVAGALSGDSNTAATFASASSEYVTIPDHAAYSLPTTNQLSLEAWAKHVDDAASFTTLIGKVGAGSTYEWWLARSNAQKFTVVLFQAAGGNRAVATAPGTSLAASGWHHVVATIDEATDQLILYVDGAEVARTAVWTGVSTNNNAAVTIGQRGDAVGYMNGDLDEVAIYDTVLSPARVAAHYAARTVSTTQTIELALLDGVSAIYAPTIAPQPVTITLGLLDGGNAIYAPTVAGAAAGAQTIGALPLLDGAAAIYAPVLTPKNTVGLPLLGGSVYHAVVLADTPVAYWRLGEPSGTNANDEIGTTDGTYVGTPTLGQGGALSGDPDTAVLFGTGKYIDVSGFVIPSPAFSLEIWADTGGAAGDMGFMAKQSFGPHTGVSLYLAGTDDIQLYLDAVTLDASDIPGFTSGWHHIVATYDGTDAAIYIDGALYSGPTTIAAPGVGANTFQIAQYGNNSGTDYPGSLDEPAVYDYALTATQVLAHYDAAIGVGGSAIYAPTITPGPAAITLGLLDAGAAIYAPTLTPQPVTVGPLALLDGASALYAPSVLQAQFLGDLALLDGGSAVYAPTLIPQPVTGGPLPLLNGEAAIYALTVLPGAVTVGPLDLLDGASALYAPTLAPQAVTVGALDLVDGSSAIYAPTLIPTNTLSIDLLDGSSEIYALTLAPISTITLDLIDAGSAIYSPNIEPDQFVDLALLDGVSAIYQPTVTVGAVTLSLDLLESASAIYDPTVQSIVGGALPFLDGGAAIYELSIETQPVTVELDLVESTPAIYDPTLTVGAVDLTLPLLDGGPDIFEPTLTTSAVELLLPLLDSPSAIYALMASEGGAAIQGITLAFLQSLPALYVPTLTQPGAPVPTLRPGVSLPPLVIEFMDSDDEEILIALLAT